MSGILFPEIVIYNTLNSIVSLLRNDLKNTEDEKKTILYKILGVDDEGNPIKMNLYNYFVQAKKIISIPKNLSVNFGYNQEVAKIISLHILLPSETAQSTIGEDEGYMDEDIFDDDGKKIGIQQKYTQMYDSTYQIMITSNNSSEVNIVYNILKSMLLMLVPHLELMGLRIPHLSGNDIIMNDEYVPVPIFHKVLNLSFKYEHTVPKLLIAEIAKKFTFEMRLIDYFDSTSNKEQV